MIDFIIFFKIYFVISAFWILQLIYVRHYMWFILPPKGGLNGMVCLNFFALFLAKGPHTTNIAIIGDPQMEGLKRIRREGLYGICFRCFQKIECFQRAPHVLQVKSTIF